MNNLLSKITKVLATSSLKDQIKEAERNVSELWNLSLVRSEEYMNALDIGPEELEILEEHSANVIVETTFGSITLIPKLTCGIPYGASWVTMLMPHCDKREHASTGRGTTYFEVINENDHLQILRAAKNGFFKMGKQ